MTLQRRVDDLERASGSRIPFVAFPSTTPELIAAAERAGRPVVRWPIDPPRLDERGSATAEAQQ